MFSEPLVSITIDDGWKNAYTHAFPILKRHGARATFYVITGLLDDENRMTKSEIAHLFSEGHEIGAHSVSHPHLTKVEPEVADNEISFSGMDLDVLGVSPSTFAYPYGEYNDDTIKGVKSARFIAARSVIEGYNDRSGDPFLLKVQKIRITTTIKEVEGWIDTAQRDSLWLILMFHQIDYSDSPIGTTPEMFDEILGLVRSKRIRIDLVRNIVHTMDALRHRRF